MLRWLMPLLLVALWWPVQHLNALEAPLAIPAPNPNAPPVNFAREILPLLSENCFHCHGPDEKSRKAKLRLDTQEGAFRKENPVLVPGKSAESEFIKRLFTNEEEDVMPPPRSNHKLTQAQKELFARWVDQGAPWGRHWAYEAPKTPPLPIVKNAAWVKNPIDQFILAKLEQENLSPSPEARKETLLRRVTLDLTGLPPTLEELDAFLADTAPDAYEKTVDRLLKSPHYGERMAWDWLDAARYSDTNGYQHDNERTMWPWRDWVIKAYNENLPFDRFTTEQLAGDLLPNATLDQKVASGFNRNHPINGEGGRIPAENRVEYVMDQTETTATVWLGVTMTCARCHDHKYDPFKQKDYYSLFAFFNQSPVDGSAKEGQVEPVIEVSTPEQTEKLKELREKEALAKKEREEIEKTLKVAQAAWEKAILASKSETGTADKPHEPKWTVLEIENAIASDGTILTKQADGSILASGPNPYRDSFTLTCRTKLSGITAFKLHALPDESLKNKGPGRAKENGNFYLSEVSIQGDGLPITLAAVNADFEQKGWPLANTLDGKLDTGWGIFPEVGKAHYAIFESLSPVGQTQEPLLSIKLDFQAPAPQFVLGRFKFEVTTDDRALLRAMPDKIRAALAVAADKRSDAQKKEIAEYYLSTHPELVAARRKAEEAKNARSSYEKTLPRVMIMSDGKPRETFVLTRGAYDKPTDKVTQNTPLCLPPMDEKLPKNRLGLARWLLHPENPLTARVTVNRIWQQFFGSGIVKTAEDFGVQSERPSHPELLDWLATEFVRSGWEVKALQRLIVTSAAYRQSSKSNAELNERDPQNRWLAHGVRRRLPAWMLRDQALALGGLLSEKMGGPAVKSYQPPGIWEEASFGIIKYVQDHGESLYRRSLYIFWRRISGPPEFFDNAGRSTCAVKPYLTNTPLHALTTLNDITYVEAARAFAQRVLQRPAQNDAERLDYAFRLATARQLEPAEKDVLLARLEKLRGEFKAQPDEAKKLLSNGESRRDEKIDPVEHAAYLTVCLLIMNLDETLNKE